MTSYVYNSPPNWPTPPAGWTPPTGWTPPVQWGLAPRGWNFWLAIAEPPAPKKEPVVEEPKLSRKELKLAAKQTAIAEKVAAEAEELTTYGNLLGKKMLSMTKWVSIYSKGYVRINKGEFQRLRGIKVEVNVYGGGRMAAATISSTLALFSFEKQGSVFMVITTDFGAQTINWNTPPNSAIKDYLAIEALGKMVIDQR